MKDIKRARMMITEFKIASTSRNTLTSDMPSENDASKVYLLQIDFLKN